MRLGEAHGYRRGVPSALVQPGRAQLLGNPVDLSAVKTDAYVLAGVADHLCDWQSCYRTGHLLGGDTRFVLSTSGHIAAIVNPPGNPKAKFQISDELPEDPRTFVKTAQTVEGTWWTDYAEMSGAMLTPREHACASASMAPNILA